MTTTVNELIATLKTALPGVGVYSGVVPSNAAVPAIALYNVSHSSSRVLAGSKTKRLSNWRITVIDTVQHLQQTIDAVELLDNTSNQYFQKLFVQLTLVEPKAPTEPHQRAFIDVTVYPK
jgi:hypothetical protein